MSVDQYLAWSGPQMGVIMIVVQLIMIVALAIWIWVADIRTKGGVSHH